MYEVHFSDSHAAKITWGAKFGVCDVKNIGSGFTADMCIASFATSFRKVRMVGEHLV